MSNIIRLIYNNPRLKSTLIIGAYIIIMIVIALFFNKYVNRDGLQDVIKTTGQLGVIVYFFIEVIYVTLTPLLNTFVLIASGYIFGGHIGFVVNFLSTSVGLFLIIFLVKRYGRPLLQKVVSPGFYKCFDQITQKVGPITLLVVYVLPFTPDDELTYLVAAWPIGFKRFILPILFGTIAKSAYSYIGDQGVSGIPIAGYFRIVMFVVGLLVVGLQEYVIKKRNYDS